MFIYKTTNLITGKIYIGQKSTLTNINNYIGSGKVLKQSIKKYGKKNFIIEIIEDGIVDKLFLNQREIFWINYFNSKDRNIGYNLTDGGDGCYNPSIETRKKMSDAQRGKPSKKRGIPLSDAQKEKMSKSQKGRIISDDQKRFLSNLFSGRKVSMETRKKLSSSLQKRKEIKRTTSCKYVGTFKCNKKWIAKISKDKIKYYLGVFPTEGDAALAYNKKALELYGETAKVNILNGDD